MPLEEIAGAKNDYNLNLPRYVDSSEPEDLQDLHAHLHGGIPVRDVEALSGYWDAFPQLRSTLFEQGQEHGYCELRIEARDARQAVFTSPDFETFGVRVENLVKEWFATHRSTLEVINADSVPNDLIVGVGEDLLARFKGLPLLDPYAVYEQLMTYWHSTMHDDIFLVMNEGWHAAAQPRPTIVEKDGKLSETPDLVIGSGRSTTKYKTDLLPPSLIVNRYFAEQQTEVESLNAGADESSRLLEEYLEEHAIEEGLLAEAMEGDMVSKVLAQARLKEAKREGNDPDEVAALEQVVRLYNVEAAARRAVKEAQATLDLVTLNQYDALSDRDVRSLLLGDKWEATVVSRIANEAVSLTRALGDRIEVLGERYGETLAGLDGQLKEFDRRLALHLASMGVK